MRYGQGPSACVPRIRTPLLPLPSCMAGKLPGGLCSIVPSQGSPSTEQQLSLAPLSFPAFFPAAFLPPPWVYFPPLACRISKDGSFAILFTAVTSRPDTAGAEWILAEGRTEARQTSYWHSHRWLGGPRGSQGVWP